jgi:hydrogenase expression/formation protein HypE
LRSDAAPLAKLVQSLLDGGIQVHAVRDMTRGGMATVVNELALASHCQIKLEETKIPVHAGVTSLCGLLGLEPYTMGNEGKLVLTVPADQAQAALKLLQEHPYGQEAAIIGIACPGSGVYLETELGGLRGLPPLQGEGLPRIC